MQNVARTNIVMRLIPIMTTEKKTSLLQKIASLIALTAVARVSMLIDISQTSIRTVAVLADVKI